MKISLRFASLLAMYFAGFCIVSTVVDWWELGSGGLRHYLALWHALVFLGGYNIVGYSLAALIFRSCWRTSTTITRLLAGFLHGLAGASVAVMRCWDNLWGYLPYSVHSPHMSAILAAFVCVTLPGFGTGIAFFLMWRWLQRNNAKQIT